MSRLQSWHHLNKVGKGYASVIWAFQMEGWGAWPWKRSVEHLNLGGVDCGWWGATQNSGRRKGLMWIWQSSRSRSGMGYHGERGQGRREDAQCVVLVIWQAGLWEKILISISLRSRGPKPQHVGKNCIEGVGEENSQSHQTAFSAQPWNRIVPFWSSLGVCMSSSFASFYLWRNWGSYEVKCFAQGHKGS